MFINHGGIEQVKLWCDVRSICVVFAVKYISSCVCASTFENLITLVLCKTVENTSVTRQRLVHSRQYPLNITVSWAKGGGGNC